MKKTLRSIDSKSDEIKIDSNKAIAIVRKFLEQYHSSIVFKSAYNDGKICMVSMEVGLLEDDIIKVAVDVKTGKILGYSH